MNAFGDSAPTGFGSSAPGAAQQPPAAAAQVQPQAAPAPAAAPVPGFDLMDGVMNIVAFPGRALIKLYKPEPDASDLPMILILSAAFWGGAWWLAHKYIFTEDASDDVRKYRKQNSARHVKFIRKTKPVVEALEEEESE